MSNETPINKKQLENNIKILEKFIPTDELKTIIGNIKSEEGTFFYDKINEMADLIKNMPVTYEQDGKGDNAIAYLHYFKGGMDWYITEKDKENEQLQAFGLVFMCDDAELGYISIIELLKNNIELDLYFEPKTLKEIKNS